MDSDTTARRRVRTDQPTILTLEQAMAKAHAAAVAALTDAAFYDIQIVVNAVGTSIDPDGDVTTWACATEAPDKPDPLLVRGLQLAAEDAEGKWRR